MQVVEVLWGTVCKRASAPFTGGARRRCADCGAASVKAYQLSKDTPSFKVRADLPLLLHRLGPETALSASSWAGRRPSSCPRRGAERRGARSQLDHSGCSRHQRTRGWPSTHSRRPSWRTSSRYPPLPSPAIDPSPVPAFAQPLSSNLHKADCARLSADAVGVGGSVSGREGGLGCAGGEGRHGARGVGRYPQAEAERAAEPRLRHGSFHHAGRDRPAATMKLPVPLRGVNQLNYRPLAHSCGGPPSPLP